MDIRQSVKKPHSQEKLAKNAPKKPSHFEPGGFAGASWGLPSSTRFKLSILFPTTGKICSLGATWRRAIRHHQVAQGLCRLLEDAEVLFEGNPCGVMVWKISGSLVDKYSGGPDTTEYWTLRYFAEHAPDLDTVPKPHGLLAFGNTTISLATYLLSMNLWDAWPSLTQENKQPIQERLSEIVAAWRALPVPPRNPIGRPRRRGAKNFHGLAGG
ncbi:hypothetical protein MAPG_00046 [Magnaporthiopsis poae ATCC 64411]|uniref:Uncharacterized protein n=1 Tax=Magnaporthiopsis poae (strain ATCC 64411 / 73-15) TaxID=644358 RepID=A0A0C4DJY6_MAGP6|nr:hypothetical protein MAPG_00046 [Magnaporthiopsis poae ATCC 64411]